jgi:hypothetical protein
MEHHKDHALRLGMSGTYARTPTTLFPLLPELSELATFANPENTEVLHAYAA